MRGAGSFTSGLAQLVEKMRYVLYGKHRRTTIDASASAHTTLLASNAALAATHEALYAVQSRSQASV